VWFFSRAAEPRNIRVQVGLFADDYDDYEQQPFFVVLKLPHPAYNRDTFANDLAVVGFTGVTLNGKNLFQMFWDCVS
jgi:hypothetical protein